MPLGFSHKLYKFGDAGDKLHIFCEVCGKNAENVRQKY